MNNKADSAAVVRGADQAPMWWEGTQIPLTGSLLEAAILAPEDTAEIRVQHLRRACIQRYDKGLRRISMQRAKIVTDSYKTTDGEHPAVRRAKAISSVFERIDIPLMPLQLFLGTPGSDLHTLEIHPEFLNFVEDEEGVQDGRHDLRLRVFRGGTLDKYLLHDEDLHIYETEVLPYWKSRSSGAHIGRELKHNYPEAWFYMTHSGAYAYKLGGPLYHTIQDYRTILEIGLAGVIEGLEARIREIADSKISSFSQIERVNIYRSSIIVAKGLISYALRSSKLAQQAAAKEADPERKAELQEMARICQKVPQQPAGSWHEALQSLHFLHMATGLAEGGNAHSVGRFDQYMYPFLDRDLKQGIIDLKKAQELLECFFLKWNESQTAPIVQVMDGVGNNDKLTIGGIDSNGNDVTNTLSHMVLEAHAHVHLTDPNISVRLHRYTPDDLLKRTLEVIRLGGGLPILISDEAIIPALVANGVSLDEARNYADLGCQENVTDPNCCTGSDTHGHNNAGWFNLVKPIELAIHDGINPANGVQVGPKTGNPADFSMFSEFSAAVKKQYEAAVRTNVILNDIVEYVYARYFPCVFHNLMHPGPREKGVSINAGGCKYNWTGSLAVGTANIGDIMSAVDYLVYERKECSWDTLIRALNDDWQGHEELRKRCIEAPKYGTDDDWADRHLRDVLNIFFRAYESYPTPRGGRFVCGLISMASYVDLGKATAATPDGRKKGEPLADSTAPSVYAKPSGLISAHRSATKAIDTVHTVNGITFNQRLTLSSVISDRGLSKWADLVRAFVETGGQSVQYSVADSETLVEAQKHPEGYADLVVRVGGYSAHFVELDKEIQDTIIMRTAGQM